MLILVFFSTVLAQFSWFHFPKTQKSCDATHERPSGNIHTHILFQFNAVTRSEGTHTHTQQHATL